MAKFLLKDVRAVLRGMRQVAQNGLDHQLTEATLRWKMSSLQPLAQNVLLTSRNKQDISSLNLSEIPSRVSAVIQGLQEQVKVATGLTSPSLVTPEGFMLFSKYEKFDKASQQKQYPTVSEEDHAKKVGLKQENGEASDAAKRAQQFMNPPVSPLDPEDKNEVVRTPEMRGSSASKEENPDDSDQASKRLGKFMNEETRNEDQKYKKDSIKTTLSFTDNASEAFKPEELEKVVKTPPGTAVPLNS